MHLLTYFQWRPKNHSGEELRTFSVSHHQAVIPASPNWKWPGKGDAAQHDDHCARQFRTPSSRVFRRSSADFCSRRAAEITISRIMSVRLLA